jgi:hypothetical protein
MFAISIKIFVGMRDRTAMTATIAVDDFVFLVVRYRQPMEMRPLLSGTPMTKIPFVRI